MTCNLILHPLVISAFQQFLFIFVAGFTTASSILRPLSFLVFLITTWVALSSFDDYVQPPGWVARTVASAFPQISLTFFERMIVRRITFENHGARSASRHVSGKQVKEPSNSSSEVKHPRFAEFRSRYAFGQLVASSMRGLGTPWEIRHIHYFDPRNPSIVPSRRWFIISNLFKAFMCYFIHTWCIGLQLSLDQSLMMPENVPVFRRVGSISIGEVRVRYSATITTVASIYCFVQGGYSLGAAVSAMLNPKSLKDWRPIFGPLSNSYCLRHFWATFWHQGLQNNLRGTAAWATSNIFGLKSYSVASRYLKILIAFFLSGLVHVPSDMGSAVPPSKSGAIQFFTTQLVGLVIEDALAPVIKPLWRTRVGGGIAHLLGYFWVITFLAWSGPVRWFPVIRMQNYKTELLSLSALTPLAKVCS